MVRMNERIINYLKSEPKFRERRNKDRGIVNLLMDMHPDLRKVVEEGLMTKELVTRIVQEHSSLDRAWRQALEQNEELRGSDYEEKVRLEQEKMLELGYTPGYERDLKQSKFL